MTIKKSLLTSVCALILFVSQVRAQKLSGVYKADQLIARISQADTVYVVNFWATWCKPCVKELPVFDSLNKQLAIKNLKVLLVNLDFLDSKNKVNDFLFTRKTQTACVLLDEVNGNDYIDRISKDWSGSIPATIIWQGSHQVLIDHKVQLSQLNQALAEFSSTR